MERVYLSLSTVRKAGEYELMYHHKDEFDSAMCKTPECRLSGQSGHLLGSSTCYLGRETQLPIENLCGRELTTHQ